MFGLLISGLIWSHVVHGRIPVFSDHSTTFNDQSNCTNTSYFECSPGGLCIRPDLVCNNEIDCPNKSDEANCDYLNCKAPMWYLCRNSKMCITSAFRCDGRDDCPNNDDEDNCEGHVPHHEVTECPDDEFTCKTDGMCLPKSNMCDGQIHCIDGSDEKYCDNRWKTVNTDFVCKNKHRLANQNWVCDGQDDCGDGSDELNCPYNCTTWNNRFLCKDNRTCIDMAKVCNRVDDCPDASDENGSCLRFANNTACPAGACPSNANCFVWPSGPHCICPKGFQYNQTTHECEDINECAQFARCSQGCINTMGSYRCTCIDKFTLRSDQHSCDSRNDTNALLLYAGRTSVTGVWLAQSSKHQFAVTEQTVQVIGVSYDGRYVYWTDIGASTESIMKAREDGSEEQVILTAGLSAPEDISVDWLTGNLYFTDKNFMHIGVCSNDGRHCVSLVNEDVHQPRNIALLPQEGRMFWTDWGDRPMIATSQMDGSSAKPFVSDNIHWPNGVALDWPNQRVYWVDAKLKTIESVDFNGMDRRVVIGEVLKHPYGIAIFENDIYWSDWKTMNIQKCNKFNCKEREVVAKDKKIYDIHLYHSGMQPKQASPCDSHSCSHLCLLSGIGTSSCACPKGMALANDQRSCIDLFKKQFLLIGLGNYIFPLEHRAFGRQEAGVAKVLLVRIDKMALNTLTGAVFVADNTARTILSVDIETTRTTDLVSRNIGKVSALCFDEVGNNLFWTDEERGTIEVLSLETKSRAIIHHYMGTDHPIALAVIPDNGQLLVALHTKYGQSHINRIPMHGRGSFHHFAETGIGYGDVEFCVDKELKYIYCVDNELQKISFTDYDGNMNHTFVTNIDGPISMAVLDEEIFWTTLDSTRLYWAPKHSPENVKKLLIAPPPFVLKSDQMHIIASTPTVIVNHICQTAKPAPCSHICVPLGLTIFGCVCPIGMVFNDAQNRTCIEAADCEFKCRSGECLSQSRKCDGRKDCADASDEQDCDQARRVTSCSFDQFKCTDGSKCVLKEHRCDMNYDCADKSDELDCAHFNQTTGCRALQFKCPENTCIDSSAKCDGFNDCDGGEDELNCSDGTSAKEDLCAGMFRCVNGQCIPTAWKCDGISDCTDGSDEHNCPRMNCPSNFFKCKYGQCIDPKLVCDGINHCGDNSDEMMCKDQKHLSIVCGEEDSERVEPTKFQCSSNTSICLDIKVRCNGTAECPRGEDEANCSGCRITEFECANKKCIQKEFRCDKAKDCSDGSDEINCGSSISTHHQNGCGDSEFDCKDGTCVEHSKVCDNHRDCANGFDESGMCDTDCTPDLCQHVCKQTPYGPVCSCNNGFVLSADRKKCYDLDECQELSPCSQECTNTEGSFRCSCFAGYMLRSDKTTCKSIEREKFMLFNSFDTIYNITSTTIQILWKSNNSRITGMDLNIGQKLLFFTLQHSSSLFEFNLQTKSIRYINHVGSPTQLAVDWITNNVYVVDELAEHTLKICHIAEKACINLLHFNYLDAIRSLAVDPVNNRLFYTILQYSISSSPRASVYSHALDGTGMAVLVNGAGHISDLVCDANKQLVFYSELSSSSIWSVKYDGTMKRQLIKEQKGVTKPIAIMLAEDQVYVLNVGSNIAAHCKVYAGRECTTFEMMAYNGENLVSSHEPNQKHVRNVCDAHKCTSSICVAAERGPKCMCNGGTFVEPGVKCKEVIPIASGSLSTSRIEKVNSSSSSSVAGTILGILGGILALACISFGFYWANKRHMIRRRFFAFQLSDATTFTSEDDEKNFLVDDNNMTTRLIRHNSS